MSSNNSDALILKFMTLVTLWHGSSIWNIVLRECLNGLRSLSSKASMELIDCIIVTYESSLYRTELRTFRLKFTI
jgi:hypothetical protein